MCFLPTASGDASPYIVPLSNFGTSGPAAVGSHQGIGPFGTYDMAGTVCMQVTRPAKFVKSRVIITDGSGREVGEVRQENVFGKIRFGLLDSAGHKMGEIRAENWRAWNFRIEDVTGSEVARITKTWEGLAKTIFTTADNYVVQIHGRLPQPLLSLVVAAALSVDTALKQDDRGWN